MAQPRKHLEFCRRRGRFWLLTGDGLSFSGSTAEELAGLAAGLGADGPLALGPKDRLTVRRPIAAFAPMLEALAPDPDLASALEQEELSDPAGPVVISTGNRVNGQAWGWILVDEGWRLIPATLADQRTGVLYLGSERRTGRVAVSSRLSGSRVP